jgi:glycosyltransferase involved in cell wall biosynthesis
MRIVSISYSYIPGFTAPETWLQRISFYTGILEQLAKKHEVFSIEQINYKGICKHNNVEYHFINPGKNVGYLPVKMHRYIKTLNPDVIFVNGFIFPLQIIQLRSVVGKKVKIVVLHRAEKPFNGVKKYLQQLADKCVNAYLFSSVEFGDMWMKHGIIKDKKKIHQVMQSSSPFQPLNKDMARSFLGVEGLPLFLWVGRLNANKDPLTVIKAFKNYLKIQPGARLYMIYQTTELLDEVKKIIGNNEAITLVGEVEHKNLQYWYNSTDFIISGSHYEGSGIAISEAMSCGCIPIVTNIISFKSMIGNSGFMYEAGNEKELLWALVKTKELNIENERSKALEQFTNELSFEAIGRKIETVIDDIRPV